MHYYRKIRTSMLCVVCVLFAWGIAGCGDSSDSQSLKEADLQLNVAQQHMLASHEKVALSEKDIDGLDLSSANRRIVASAVDRLEGTESGELEENLGQMAQTLEKLKLEDYPALQGVSRDLIVLSERFLAERREGNSRSGSAYRDRIQKARRALSEAALLSQETGDDEDQLGPYLVLGTLHLMIGRDLRKQMWDLEINIQNEQMAIGRLTTALVTEKAFGTSLPAHFPYEVTVNQLNNRVSGDRDLTGEPESLQSQLERAQKTVAALQTRQSATQSELDRYRAMAKENLQEHLKLLEQSEQIEGDESYALKYQAYALRNGGDEEEEEEKQGGLDYEAQSELLENELAIIETRLRFARFQQEQLISMIAQVNRSVGDLKDSPLHATIAAQAEHSRKRANELVLYLEAQLENIKAIDKAYRDLRLETVNAYRDAEQAFMRASRLARDDRKSRDYAKRMAQIAHDELLGSTEAEAAGEEGEGIEGENPDRPVVVQGLWDMDAEHYDSMAAFMQDLGGIAEISVVAGELEQDYLGQAKQARNSISEQNENEQGG